MDDCFVNLGEEVILTLLRQYGASEYLLLTVQMLSFEHCVCVCVCVCVCEREGGSQRSVVREREKGGDHSVASCERESQREGHSTASCVCVRERVTAQHRVCVCLCVRERESERERGSQRSVVCEREGHSAAASWVCVFVCVRERGSQRSIVCVCVRERESERERGPQRSVVCKREGHSAAASWVCVCEREEDTVIQPRLCASTYELHHSVCHATLFRSRTDGKTKEIINCL